jgi:hemin uptake protein HemP
MKEDANTPAADRPVEAPDPPRIDSADLFRGARMIVIAHAGEEYRLLLTRNNRLILQK